jgi:hypothetical protein
VVSGVPDYGFLSSPTYADPNRDGLFGGITAAFGDGSQITIVPRGTDHEGRQRYAYSVTQQQLPRTVAAGEDLHSGIDRPVDYRRALADLAVFADARADEDADGDPFQDWAYRHDTELSELVLQLQEDVQVWDGEVESIVAGQRVTAAAGPASPAAAARRCPPLPAAARSRAPPAGSAAGPAPAGKHTAGPEYFPRPSAQRRSTPS